MCANENEEQKKSVPEQVNIKVKLVTQNINRIHFEDEQNITQVLNYSERDFPSLENSIKKSNRIKPDHVNSRKQNASACKNLIVLEKIRNPKSKPRKNEDTLLENLNCENSLNSNVCSAESYSNETHSRKKFLKVKRNTIQNIKKSNDQYLNTVLKSDKHKASFAVGLEDILSKTETKRKTRSLKQVSGNLILSGNQLDSDNPIRQKGKVSLIKRPKPVSKIKSLVCNSRMRIKEIEQLSEHVTVKHGNVYVNSTVSVNDLWKSLYFGKLKELKSSLNPEISKFHTNVCENNNDNHKDINQHQKITDADFKIISETSDITQNISTSSCTKDSVKIENDCSEDNTCEEKFLNKIPLIDVLNASTVPPYKLLIHRRNFRRYCDNLITTELNNAVQRLISQIVRYQYNKYQVNSIKAVANKRYVLGLRQVKKYTQMNKIKLIVLVPDMEDSLCDVVDELKSLATAYCIPYLFAFSRKKLGWLAYKKVGVSCFGILDYSGADENFKKGLEIMTKTKKLYEERCSLAIEHYNQYMKNASSENQELLNDKVFITDFCRKLSLTENNTNDTINNLE